VTYQLPPYTVELPLTAASIKEVDWGVEAAGIPALWQHTQGAGVRIAVIDSGCAEHYALRAVKDKRNFSTDDAADDLVGHGTHVTGIICADQAPCRGIAQQSEVHSLKVLNKKGRCSAESVADALDYATSIGVDLVCMSLGSTTPSITLHSAIQRANAEGIIIVAAAGNDGGHVNFPAAHAEVLAIGAVDDAGNVCPFSSQGDEIVCAAPGQDIQSTWLAGGYATVSGTSMAAPFVVGVLALYISTLGRRATPQEVLLALEATARDAGPPGKDKQYGWGLIDAHKLVHYKAHQFGALTLFMPEKD
jgi:subtilisin family serine protease